jgi:Zn2+/Cd2+-exporting ATPase
MHAHSHSHAPSGPAAPPISAAIATALCAALGIAALLLQRSGFAAAHPLFLAAAIAAYLAGGIGPTRHAWESLRHGVLTVDVLMLAAALGAAAIGDWGEGLVLLFLFSLSGALEAFASFRTSRSIESLVQLRPREALLVPPADGHASGNASSASNVEQRVPVDSLTIGAVVRVRPGERFPVDGVVTEGETWADESTLTGESEPIEKSVGASVFAGTINGQGSVLVRMTKAVADTTIERIVHMVQDAQAQKTPTQLFVESWERPYVLGVFAVSALVFLGARVLGEASWYEAFYRAMVLLVAASPCAVVVSSPAVMLSAIARAGRLGVLFKGGVHVEALGKATVMAFDKTGTVTVGKPSVVAVWAPPGADENRLLTLAAAVERRSEHPLGLPVIDEAHRRGLDVSRHDVSDFQSRTGQGVHARVDGMWIGIGRETLFQSHETQPPADLLEHAERIRNAGQTALLVVTADPSLYGVIAVADRIRPEAAAAFAALKQLGVERLVILTGDHERVARAIAASLNSGGSLSATSISVGGVSDADFASPQTSALVAPEDLRAGLMPDEKVAELRRLADKGATLAMVGDGVNDAPALATANVGVAMGGRGSDVALEVADVVLMRDDLRALPAAVWISRVARRRVRQNMAFAFAMIAVLVTGSFFELPLWLGVLGHEGSTVLVVFNGLRILWERVPRFG